MTDPIGDLIIRLKNASSVGKPEVQVPFSKLKYAIAVSLKKNKYVQEVEEKGEGTSKVIAITLAYDEGGKPKIHDVKRISKPGRRLYAKVSKIHPVKYGRGLLLLTTPRGIMTDVEARRDRVGGEMLFSVW